MNWSERFNKVDNLVALGMSKIGLKSQSKVLDPTNDQYWTSIIERWQVLRVIFVFAYIPFGIYMVYNAENMKYMNPLQFILPLSVYLFLVLICYHVEMVLYGFQRGREQKKKGNNEIKGIHICKILIFPTVFSISFFTISIMTMINR